VSDLNKKIYGTIEAWRNRAIEGEHPYVYLDGIVLKRSWAGEVRNVSLLVAIGVNERGYREILGICEGATLPVYSFKLLKIETLLLTGY
jgi:putative transposase